MNSFIAYLGGKSILSKEIIPLIPKHECYCEVFAGAAWMLFRKEPSKVEIINDINSELTNLYRCVKLHLEEFIRYFKWVLIARDEFERLKQESPDTLTDIQRAARYYYLLRLTYGAKITNFSFSPTTTRMPKINLLRIEEDLSEAHLRLSRVFVKNMPYQKIIQRYDREHTFFYLDPPYWDCEDYYGKGLFSKQDFVNLAHQLSSIKGKFIMSINDAPEIRQTFKKFNIKVVSTRYSLATDHVKNVKELLIYNYDFCENNLGTKR